MVEESRAFSLPPIMMCPDVLCAQIDPELTPSPLQCCDMTAICPNTCNCVICDPKLPCCPPVLRSTDPPCRDCGYRG